MSPAPTPTPESLTRDILAQCQHLGFALAGVARVEPSDFGPHFSKWIGEGKHATMDYLAEHAEVRADPARYMEGVRAFVMVADLYATRQAATDPGPAIYVTSARGRIARYARGKDYHNTMRTRLKRLRAHLWQRHPSAKFRVFTDNVPLFERELARKASLGWQAKNTMLIHPRLGSYLLLGGLATDLPLIPSDAPATDHCGSCTRCIDACPTQAITPYSIDASRCISYLTIEREQPIDPELAPKFGEWLFGCDICQEVCPHNSPRPDAADVPPPHPAYAPVRDALLLAEVLQWNEAARSHAFAGTSMKRASLAVIKRNAAIVAGNALARHPNASLREALERVAGDETEPEMVREAARRALGRST